MRLLPHVEAAHSTNGALPTLQTHMKSFNKSGESRAFGRRQSHIHAFVHVAGLTPRPCIVRDLSEAGARLDFLENVELPTRVRLVVETKAIDTLCDVRHQQGSSVGVMFVSEPAEKTKPRPTMADLPPSEDEEAAPMTAPVDRGRPMLVTPGREMRRLLFGAEA